MSELIVEDGRIVSYRLFDVGDSIRLDVAHASLRDERSPTRPKLGGERGQGLLFATPPLDVELGARSLELPAPHGRQEVVASVRIYDYGAVSVRLEIPIAPGTDLESLVPLCDHLYDAPAVDACSLRELEAFLPEIARAIEQPHRWKEAESYTVTFVRALRGHPVATDVLADPLLVKLLLGEVGERRMSEDERRDVLAHARSYFDDDLAVVDWNSAFVLEPSGGREILDVLDFANAQLLELRYYDALLDGDLRRIYEDISRARRSPARLFYSPYPALARAVQRRVLEVTEFTERVDNALKVVGDFYLARVYDAAVERLRIVKWQASVAAKQRLVAQAYDLLKGEVDMRRSVLMELVVVLLILFELVAALRGH